MLYRSIFRFWAGIAGAVLTASFLCSPAQADPNSYQQTNLVSDGVVTAVTTDTNLKNPWGIAFGPTTPFWISDNGTGLASIYDATGTQARTPVTIPLPGGATGASRPTGAVFNGISGFVVTGASGSGPALFLFATEDGTIAGWSPAADTDNAIIAVDQSAAGSVFTGLAMAKTRMGSFLYAADFHNGMIYVFDSTFTAAGSFTDPNAPAGFAPFGIQNVNGYLVVTFAMQDANQQQAVPGAGAGFVDIFDPHGMLVSHFASGGTLNAPWGIALAPEDFGRFGGALLIGNLGDGHINAYNPHNRHFLGQLNDVTTGAPVAIDGLWSLTFGNPIKSSGKGKKFATLFFTAGPNVGADGIFGMLQPAPEANKGNGNGGNNSGSGQGKGGGGTNSGGGSSSGRGGGNGGADDPPGHH